MHGDPDGSLAAAMRESHQNEMLVRYNARINELEQAVSDLIVTNRAFLDAIEVLGKRVKHLEGMINVRHKS